MTVAPKSWKIIQKFKDGTTITHETANFKRGLEFSADALRRHQDTKHVTVFLDGKQAQVKRIVRPTPPPPPPRASINSFGE